MISFRRYRGVPVINWVQRLNEWVEKHGRAEGASEQTVESGAHAFKVSPELIRKWLVSYVEKTDEQ